MTFPASKPSYPKPNAGPIPASLKDLRQWVTWRAKWVDGKDDKPGKYTKIPYRADGRGEASSTDPATWSSFLDAAAAYRRGGFDGVGFVLTEAAGIVGFDLDDSFVAEDGNPTDEAKEYLDALNSYTERSPSGKGFRVFVRGILPPEGRKRGDFECYSWGRFLTVTGARLMQYPATVEARQEAINAVHARVWPPISRERERPVQERRQASGAGFAGGDADLLAKAFTAKNGDKFRALYGGDTSGYPGASEADEALCSMLAFWTGGDAARMDSLFRSSALCRDKWDEARGVRTYGERTIDFALAHCTEFYSPPGVVSERFGRTSAGVETSTPAAPFVPFFDGPPRPLAVELLPVPAFDCNLLPVSFRGWVLDITRRVACPIEFVAAALMVALSAAIGRRVGIRPKRHDDWTVICNLWGAALGLPGAMKTPAVNEALAPLKRIEAEAKERYDGERELYELDALTAKAQAEGAKRELSKAAKPGVDRESLRALASESRPELPDPPTRTRFIINDATPEAMGVRLNENPFGLLYYSDELLTFLYSLDKPGYEGARQFYLQCWNGDGAHTYDRITRGTLDIEACCVSIFGTTQPGPFARYLRGAASGADADGFASRFSVMVYPDLPRSFEYVDRYPDAIAKAQANAVFDRLTSLTAQSAGAQSDEFKPVPFLRFDAQAQTFFDEWYTRLRNRLLSESDTPLMQLHLSKFPKLMPSLALILWLADGGQGSIPLSAAITAADWCELLEAHARRIYHAATEGDISGAATLAERIKAGKLESPFTYREVYQKSWVGLTAPEQINSAIARLVEYDWLVAEDAEYDGAGRPKATRYHINPLAMASEKSTGTPCTEPTKTYKTPK